MLRQVHLGSLQGSVPKSHAKPAKFVGDGDPPESRHCLGHELIDHYLRASGRAAHYLPRERYRGGPSQPRVYIQKETVVFHAASDVQLAHVGGVKLVEEGGDVEAVIVGIAFQIVSVQNQPATGSIRQRVEKPGIGMLAGGIRNNVNHVFQEEGKRVPFLDNADSLLYHVQRLFGLGHGQHDA